MRWLVATAFSLATVAAAQDVDLSGGGWLEPGDTLKATEPIVWRPAIQFQELVYRATEAEMMREEQDLLLAEVEALRAAVAEYEKQVAHLERVIELTGQEAAINHQWAETLEERFHRVNDELESERKRSRPWLMSGVQLGVGVAHDGEAADVAVYIGYGVTFNVRGR